jgi:peptidyl-dipeptidase Dcp
MKKKKSKTINHSLVLMATFCVILILVIAGCSKSEQPPEPQSQPMKEVAGDNPLLSAFDTPFQVPPFDKIKEEHYLPAFEEGIRQQAKEIEAIVNNPEPPTFANTIAAQDRSGALVRDVDNIFNAIKEVNTTPRLQEIAKEISPLKAGHRDDILLNAQLFQRVKAVYDQKDQLDLSEEQGMALEKYYKEFVRGGANLDSEKQTRLRQINKEESLLEIKFGDNILAENNRFELVIDKKEDLAGLPADAIAAAAETAAERGHKGKWVFTLHKPCLIPFLRYSDKRELREKMFKGYISRGDHGDELDNKSILIKILSLREERAKLFGFDNHAEYQLDQNMAKKPKAVYDLLYQLWKPVLAMAKKEAKALQELINKEGGTFKLEPWDWWYYTEKLKKAKYDVDENLTRPYFKLENVRDGAFYVANQLYGLKFIPMTNIPTYHPDVRVFEVQEADGSHLGVIYLDYFPRASKQGGAWMNSLRDQIRLDGKEITPVVTNNGNFTKPTADTPSLLSYDEVTTLFHEFGHALHGLFSNSSYYMTSCNSVPIDFVELPSQIMENWASEPEVLKVYAKHYKTGEIIPTKFVEKIKNANQKFNQGFTKGELLAASFLDMDWHTAENPAQLEVNTFETQSLNKIGLIPEIVVRYRSTYFNHIFSSMYSAGYYSYTWAEVLDADAFKAFKENGLFDQKTAQAFRKNILEKGGTADAMTLYKRFRGAEPKIEPLLERNGLVEK